MSVNEKKKEKSISQLKKIADKLTSELVRRSYANWKEEVRCYTCDKIFTVKTIQCGHFVSRVYTNTRWLLSNLRPQCYSCNVMKNGNLEEFAARLERESPGIVIELNNWKHRPSSSNTRNDLLSLIEVLENKIKKL